MSKILIVAYQAHYSNEITLIPRIWLKVLNWVFNYFFFVRLSQQTRYGQPDDISDYRSSYAVRLQYLYT